MTACVKICIPVYDMSTYDKSIARACIETLKKTNCSFQFEAVAARSTIIEEGRNILICESFENQMIQQKLNKKYTHWIFVDHDCGFTKENVERLIALNHDIVSGAYRPKDKPERFVAGFCSDTGRITDYTPAIQQGVIQVDWTGGGFLLCKRETLERMQYPWFWKSIEYYGNRAMTVGEDVYFCLNARKNLIAVHLDTETVLNHEANRYDVQTQAV